MLNGCYESEVSHSRRGANNTGECTVCVGWGIPNSMLWIDTNSIAVDISIFLKSRLPPGSQVKKVIHVANTNMISDTHMEFVALAVINKHNSRFTAKQQCIFVIKSFKKESDYGKFLV